MNFKINTLRNRIRLGFATMVALLLVTIGVTSLVVQNINDTADRLITRHQPSMHAEVEVLSGINHSMAALRGWIILERDSFREEFNDVWQSEIRVSTNRLQNLSERWENEENVEHVMQLVPLIEDLYDEQKRVEELTLSAPDEAVSLLENSVLEIDQEIRVILNELITYHENLTNTGLEDTEQQIGELANIQFVLLAVALIIGFILSVQIVKSVITPIDQVVSVANNISKGKVEKVVKIEGANEVKTLGNSLEKMRQSIKEKKEEAQLYEWMTSGQNELNKRMRGDQDVTELANNIIEFLTTYVVASIGALYLVNDNEESLELIGKYAFSTKIDQHSFHIDEGLIGQAASGKQTIQLTEIDENYIRVTSSIAEAPPKNIIAIPILVDGEILGVVEIGKFEKFTQLHIDFLESNMESVGIALSSAIARQKIQNLLEETQLQSEELQQQQEELKQSNEELEEQAHSLKEQQEELRVANEELEEQTQVVEQKNQDLERARTEIELKAEQLEISSKYKSEFLANMSHELRTPLNSLLILAGDLKRNKKGNLSDDELENAEVIEKSGHDLLVLINEILDLSKIEAGKMELNLNEVNVGEMANNLTRNFKAQAEQKELSLTVNINENVPKTIYTDRQRLEQILKNLLSNALKFTEEGEIKLSCKKNTGDYISFSVTDTGIGIPQEKQDLIFEAFQQADGGTSRKYGGTGLGLSISRELAKLLNGEMTLESAEGKGSTFTVTIPIALEKSDTYVPEQPAKGPTRSNKTIKNSRFIDFPTIDDHRENISEDDDTILIIEDDLNFAKILGKQATENGFKYIAAATGEDGLTLANKHQPTAIILDLNLPGIDGHMVLRELKGNPDVRHIPVHIISAEEKSLSSIKSGAVQYLTKPVTEKQLQGAFGRIEDFINREMKNLLVVEDDETLRKSIVKLIGNGDVKCFEAATAKEALQRMKENHIDCIVLDIGLPDISGFDLIKQIEEDFNETKVPPIIVYTGKELTKDEVDKLQEYAETIIVKGIKSEERLLDETALFLHRTVKNLPKNKQEMITSLYDKESVFKNKKVLIVDDDMRNVFALSKVLKEKGIQIERAENGRVALHKLDETVIDLVLMDIMMPEMDGYECMKEIRKQDQFQDLPIIALTAKAMKNDRQKCLDAGADDYITKPVDLERLLSLMRIWIKK